MKSQKGVTMTSLILYVASFLVVTTVIAGITTFFYNNVDVLDTKVGSNSQYNKINLYMLNECKKYGNSLYAWKNATNVDEYTVDNISSLAAASTDFFSAENGGKNNTFITFQDSNGNKNSFIYVAGEKNLYYNSIKLGEDIEDFKFKIDYSSGKTVLKIYIDIDGTVFTTDYVVES